MQLTPLEIDSPAARLADRKADRQNAHKRPRAAPRRMPFWIVAVYCLATIGPAFLFARRGDFVTAGSIVMISLCGFIGFRMGLGSIIATLLGLVAAIGFAPMIAMRYEANFSERFGTTGLTNRILCIAIVGVLISLLTTLLMIVISNWILGKRSKLHLSLIHI